eukprot:35508_1
MAASSLLWILIMVGAIINAFPVSKPNIIFILTDDQDITLDGMEETTMQQTTKLLVNQGLTFTNSFVSSPICCVSRSSIMSGRYVHNTGVYNNSLSGGCSNITWQTNIEPNCFAATFQELGYNTFYAGKYLNQYGFAKAGGVAHIPKGWIHWKGLVGNSKYYNYSISNNGIIEKHGDNYANDYYTDLIHNQSITFLNNNIKPNEPFLMVMASPAAHGPFTPAPQYANTDQNEQAPRIPNFNDVSVNIQKHDLFRKYIKTPMNSSQIKNCDQIWRHRHGTLKSVDDMIYDIYNTLNKKNLLNNTYFVYFSDNGFQDGQFGQIGDKRQLYENDIRIPFYISGPGIAKGVKTDIMALNIDIAPTLIDLANGQIPNYMDGMSLKPYLFDSKYHYKNIQERMDNEIKSIKQQFLVEYHGEDQPQNSECDYVYGACDRPIDSWNNTYSCVRMIDGEDMQVNGTIYCQFKCFVPKTHIEIQCPDKNVAQFSGEFYDLDKDYYELNNNMLSLNSTTNGMYEQMLQSFKNCKGQTQCNALRQGH